MFASRSTKSFYDAAVHGGNMPADVTPESEWKYTHVELMKGQSDGKLIYFGEDGYPFLADPPPPAPLTIEQIEALRLAAYAEPVTGSDRFFAEVSRMQAMGEAGWEALRDQGAARYEEIKVEYPWPS